MILGTIFGTGSLEKNPLAADGQFLHASTRMILAPNSFESPPFVRDGEDATQVILVIPLCNFVGLLCCWFIELLLHVWLRDSDEVEWPSMP